MNAETGTEPEAPKKRGRIPQSAWPQILERYRSGATLSAIAREFECTPSAISYIIRKAEAAGGEKDEAATDAADSAVTETPAVETPAPAAPATETAAPAAAPAPVQPAAPAAPPVAETPVTAAPLAKPVRAERRVAEPKAEGTRPAASAAPQQTETLRLNRPDPQPAPQPAPAPVAAPVATAPEAQAAQADAGRTGTNPPPVDAVESRLRDTARGCLTAYRGWRQTPGEASIQALSEAVHELRKALARIEIDMSASRREEQAIRPIPIPAHRTARRTP